MRFSDWRSDVGSYDLHADFHDRTGNARWQAKRGVAHVTRRFSEDGAEEFFFRRHRALALRRDLTYQNVARLHLGSDIADARLIEAAKGFFTDIRDVAGNVFRLQHCVARPQLTFLDLDQDKDVILNDPLHHQYGLSVVLSSHGT